MVIVTLAGLHFFPPATLPLKLSCRGFGSPEMRKSFIFDFPLCGECRSGILDGVEGSPFAKR